MQSPFPSCRTLAGLALLLLTAATVSAHAEEPPKFSQYPAGNVYAGRVAVPKINARKDPDLQRAYEAVEKPKVDAVGRYVLLKESCGAACVVGHLLDARTGRIIHMAMTISGWREIEDNFEPIVTRADSRLIVLRGMRDEQGINGAHYYTFEANGKLKHLMSIDTDGNFEKPLTVD